MNEETEMLLQVRILSWLLKQMIWMKNLKEDFMKPNKELIGGLMVLESIVFHANYLWIYQRKELLNYTMSIWIILDQLKLKNSQVAKLVDALMWNEVE